MANTPISQFVTGAGYESPEAIARMIALKQQQDAEAQAQLDAFRVAPGSYLYQVMQNPSSIPRMSGETEEQALARVKQNAMEQAQLEARRAVQSNAFPDSQFVGYNAGINDADGRPVEVGAGQVGNVITDANGVPRYMTQAEAAQQQQAQQDWLRSNGYVASPQAKRNAVNLTNYNDANGVPVGAPRTAIPPSGAPASEQSAATQAALSQVPAEVWKRWGITDPSKLQFVQKQEYNSEIGQNIDTYSIVDPTSGLEIPGGVLGDVGGGMVGHFAPDAQGNLTYQTQKPEGFSLGGLLGGIAGGLGSIATSNPMLTSAALNLALPGIGSAIGQSLGLSGAAAAATGGAIFGGATSAALGGNPLVGAALGGAGGYLQGGAGPMGADYTVPYGSQPLDASFNKYLAPVSADYSLTGNTNPNLPSMGGGQGLVQNANPNLDYMGGGQGITAPTSANLTSMGGGQGITTNAAGGGTLGQTGVNTGASLLPTNQLTGQQLGTSLSNLNTGVTSPFVTGGGVTGTTGSTTGTGAAAGAAAGTAAGAGVLGTGLTAGQLAALGSGVGSLLGSSASNNAITNAQNIQNAAAAKSQGTLSDIYNQNLAFTKPYQDIGVQGVNAIQSNLPYFQNQFNANDLTTNLAPNYAFQLGQGQMANQRAANVGGGALSGNTLTGLNRYTQDYAGNAYQQAFNNYNTQRNNIYNTLSGIAGLGNTANAQAIGAGNTYGTNTTNLATGLAAAQAGATVAQGQNQANTLNNIVNNAALLLGQNNASPSQSNANLAINPYFQSGP